MVVYLDDLEWHRRNLPACARIEFAAEEKGQIARHANKYARSMFTRSALVKGRLFLLAQYIVLCRSQCPFPLSLLLISLGNVCSKVSPTLSQDEARRSRSPQNQGYKFPTLHNTPPTHILATVWIGWVHLFVRHALFPAP